MKMGGKAAFLTLNLRLGDRAQIHTQKKPPDFSGHLTSGILWVLRDPIVIVVSRLSVAAIASLDLYIQPTGVGPAVDHEHRCAVLQPSYELGKECGRGLSLVLYNETSGSITTKCSMCRHVAKVQSFFYLEPLQSVLERFAYGGDDRQNLQTG
jgi:hypothetical protein